MLMLTFFYLEGAAQHSTDFSKGVIFEVKRDIELTCKFRTRGGVACVGRRFSRKELKFRSFQEFYGRKPFNLVRGGIFNLSREFRIPCP